ncbi:hypothetical protein [Paenibacillus riograndensis]|uniref:Uncharacterized protein n=1 Tax=Paenibacillus riograndensis SBR5 TaxID=1073571 RepID=A0A0E4HGG6_9BACL|nr:hypothetical protein [Paenibacillus riograndensis]CQR59109.1 hypothetical protein PRIO_6762 [Paenibacillus riograndensis SBR5]
MYLRRSENHERILTDIEEGLREKQYSTEKYELMEDRAGVLDKYAKNE